jgi:hypothetical protein
MIESTIDGRVFYPLHGGAYRLLDSRAYFPVVLGFIPEGIISVGRGLPCPPRFRSTSCRTCSFQFQVDPGFSLYSNADGLVERQEFVENCPLILRQAKGIMLNFPESLRVGIVHAVFDRNKESPLQPSPGWLHELHGASQRYLSFRQPDLMYVIQVLGGWSKL